MCKEAAARLLHDGLLLMLSTGAIDHSDTHNRIADGR